MNRKLRKTLDCLRHDRLSQLLIALAIFCAAGDFLLVRTAFFNADNVESFNALNGFLKGNVLLKGWFLTTDNFYLSDLPLFIIGSVFLHVNTALIYLIPYFTLLCLLAGAVLLVWQNGATKAQKKWGVISVLLLIGVPYTQAQSILLVSGCHGAIIAYSIFGLVVAQKILTKPNYLAGWLSVFCLIVFIVTSSDPQVDVYFIAPFIILTALRTWLFRRISRHEIYLLIGIIIFGVFGSIFPYGIGHIGGLHIIADVSSHFIPTLPALIHSIIAFVRQMAMSFGALPIILIGLPAHHLIAISHLLIFLLVLILCGWIFWSLPYQRNVIIAQWLVCGVLVLAAADIMSALFANLPSNPVPGQPTFMFRYVTPAFIYAALAATIQGQTLFANATLKLQRVAKYFAFFTAFFLLLPATEAIAIAARRPVYLHIMPQQKLADWLISHQLTYGVGDYWTAQMLNALTSGRVTADSVTPKSYLAAFHWAGDSHNIDSKRPPQFVVFTPKNDWNITLQDVTNTYGPPASVSIVNGYIIAVLKPPA